MRYNVYVDYRDCGDDFYSVYMYYVIVFYILIIKDFLFLF